MESYAIKIFMVNFLLVILGIFILIYYPIMMGGYGGKKKINSLEKLENMNKTKCCGNIDWYYGNKLYKELCDNKDE